MSYILDALKKNKSSDEQSEVPDLSSEHAYHEFEEEKSLTRWILPLIVMLLVLIIGVLAFMLLNPSAKEISERWTQKTSNHTPIEETQPMSSLEASGAPLTSYENASNAVEENKGERSQNDTQIVNKPLEVSEPIVQKVQRRTANRSANASQHSKAASNQNEQTSVTKADLPSLVYTTHIYATQPKDRFVMLNGRAYGEGDTISQDLVVKEILENDLVVIYRGQEFTLPNLEDVNVN